MLSLFRTSDVMVKIYDRELYFLEQCLRVNPKCYSTWHQRGWVLDKMEVPDWKRELALCNKFLDYDERNCKKLIFYANCLSTCCMAHL